MADWPAQLVTSLTEETEAKMDRLDGWLYIRNLKGFLVVVSEIVGYSFDALDWEAVVAGLSVDPSDHAGAWFRYPLAGRDVVEVSINPLVDEDTYDLRVNVRGDQDCLREQIRAAWLVFNRLSVNPDVEM